MWHKCAKGKYISIVQKSQTVIVDLHLQPGNKTMTVMLATNIFKNNPRKINEQFLTEACGAPAPFTVLK